MNQESQILDEAGYTPSVLHRQDRGVPSRDRNGISPSLALGVGDQKAQGEVLCVLCNCYVSLTAHEPEPAAGETTGYRD